MSEIDWSKAPEWANYLAVSELGHSVWCELLPRLMDSKDNWQGGGNWTTSDLRLSDLTTRLIPRPVEPAWSGEGLPPAGCECEVLNTDLSNAQWEKCTILFVGAHRILYDSESCSERVGYTDTLQFRPIRTRTPEQIEDAEREAAIKDMAETISTQFSFGWVFEKLYDAGFRKI